MRRGGIVLSVRGLKSCCFLFMSEQTPDRCYAKGEKEGFGSSTSRSRTTTHINLRQGARLPTRPRIPLGYVLFLSFHAFALPKPLAASVNNPDQAHMYAVEGPFALLVDPYSAPSSSPFGGALSSRFPSPTMEGRDLDLICFLVGSGFGDTETGCVERRKGGGVTSWSPFSYFQRLFHFA